MLLQKSRPYGRENHGACNPMQRRCADRPYTFRPSSKLLLNPKGNKVRLTEKETSILRYLYRAGQRPVSRETRYSTRSGATIQA
jgi:DNA-binding response OmpR family regulator